MLRVRHLRYIVSQYVEYFSHKRPHEGRDHLPPATKEPPAEAATVKVDDVFCRERLGGLLRYYYRDAA